MAENAGSAAPTTEYASKGFRDALLDALPALRRFVGRFAATEAEREDLIQATCERALANLDAWCPSKRMETWLFRIAHNLAVDQARSVKRRNALFKEVVEPATATNGDARTEMESRFTLREVRLLIDRLPEDQRRAIIAVCIEGLSYDAAAHRLGIAPGTLMSRLYRGRMRLQAALEKGASDGTTANDTFNRVS